MSLRECARSAHLLALHLGRQLALPALALLPCLGRSQTKHPVDQRGAHRTLGFGVGMGVKHPAASSRAARPRRKAAVVAWPLVGLFPKVQRPPEKGCGFCGWLGTHPQARARDGQVSVRGNIVVIRTERRRPGRQWRATVLSIAWTDRFIEGAVRRWGEALTKAAGMGGDMRVSSCPSTGRAAFGRGGDVFRSSIRHGFDRGRMDVVGSKKGGWVELGWE